MADNDDNWVKVLKAIQSELRAGFLECNGMKGEVGELVATIILTRCFDSLHSVSAVSVLEVVDSAVSSSDSTDSKRRRISSSSDSPAIIARSMRLLSVAEFIESFVAGCTGALESTSDMIRSGLVGFTRFVRVESPMTCEFLRELFRKLYELGFLILKLLT